MTYMGIDRALPNPQTDEQKAAAARIGHHEGQVFFCRECQKTGEFPMMIEHNPECETGRVLERFRIAD
jgi:hypothetical protein